MTPEQFAAQIEQLITAGRDGHLSDEAMIEALEEAVRALREGVS
jgi:predicted alpha/beta hydrolase family esterase